MSGTERLERLLRPAYLFLMFLGYARLFLCMLPALAAAALLGRFSGGEALSRFVFREEGRRGIFAFFRAHGWPWTLAALAWDAAALALSVFLGRWNGWLILYARRGRALGACMGAAGFFLGRLWRFLKNKEA